MEPWNNDAQLYQPYEAEQILLAENASCLAVKAFLNVNILCHLMLWSSWNYPNIANLINSFGIDHFNFRCVNYRIQLNRMPMLNICHPVGI